MVGKQLFGWRRENASHSSHILSQFCLNGRTAPWHLTPNSLDYFLWGQNHHGQTGARGSLPQGTDSCHSSLSPAVSLYQLHNWGDSTVIE